MTLPRYLKKYGKLDVKTEARLIRIYLSSKSYRISDKAHRRLCGHWGINYNEVRNDK